MTFLLDTDVVSQSSKKIPDPDVLRWLAEQPIEQAAISVATLYQVRYGIERAGTGRRKRELESWYTTVLQRSFSGRILPIDEQVADLAGSMFEREEHAGRNPELNDIFIAATAKVHNLTLATLNRKHFAHLGLGLVQF